MKVLWIVTLIAFTWGMTSLMVLGAIYNSMHRDLKRETNKNTLIKQIKLKYDNCRKMEITVNNAGAFVEKLIKNYTFCGLSLDGWQSMSHICSLVCIITGVINAIVYRYDFSYVTFGLGISALSALGIKVTDQIVDGSNQMRTLVVNMVDYLENTATHRNIVKEEIIQSQKLSRKAVNEFNRLNRSYEKIKKKTEKSHIYSNE